MPLHRVALYQTGVEIWCAPTVDARDVWQSTMRHIAVEGRCYVVSACQYIEGTELTGIAGGTVIVDPYGHVLAGPLRNQEGLITAEIDLDEFTRASLDLGVIGHYARPDIYQLIKTSSQ